MSDLATLWKSLIAGVGFTIGAVATLGLVSKLAHLLG